MPENQITTNFIHLTSSNFVTISHINCYDQLNSWKNLWKFWNGRLYRSKSGPSPLLSVVVYWQSSNTEAWAKKLSQILANNIYNWRKGIDLRIYVRYWAIETNPTSPLTIFFASIWDSFLAQVSILPLFQYAATLSRM